MRLNVRIVDAVRSAKPTIQAAGGDLVAQMEAHAVTIDENMEADSRTDPGLAAVNEAVHAARNMVHLIDTRHLGIGLKSPVYRALQLLLENRAEGHMARGLVCEVEKEVNCLKAIDDLMEAMSIDRCEGAWENTAWHLEKLRTCHSALGRCREALTDAEQMVEQEPGFDGLWQLAFCYLQLERYGDALSTIDRGIKLATRDCQRCKGWQLRAEINLAARNPGAAEQDKAEALRHRELVPVM